MNHFLIEEVIVDLKNEDGRFIIFAYIFDIGKVDTSNNLTRKRLFSNLDKFKSKVNILKEEYRLKASQNSTKMDFLIEEVKKYLRERKEKDKNSQNSNTKSNSNSNPTSVLGQIYERQLQK